MDESTSISNGEMRKPAPTPKLLSLEKSNSEDKEKARLNETNLCDMLSEHSQVKSSESIDEQVFHEKLAYLVASDSTASRSFRTKIIDSIKRRLSLPGGAGATESSPAKKEDNQVETPSQQPGPPVLTPAEKERLRRQLNYYHRHYLEHRAQLNKQHQTVSNESSAGWSAMNLEQKRRLFRLGQASKTRIINFVSSRRGVKQPVNDSSAHSSAHSFHSASFKTRANGSLPVDRNGPKWGYPPNKSYN